MIENKVKIYKKPAAATLLLCWLFIFLLPAVTFHFCLQWLFDLTYQANCRVVNSELINEMTMFKKQATTETALEKLLFKACAKLSPPQFGFDAKVLSRHLEQELGFPVAACVSHNEDFSRIDFFQSSEFRRFIKVMPRRFTQRLLQDLHSGSDTTDSSLFIRQQFSLIAEVPLKPKKIIKSISGRLRGPVYFFYHPRSNEARGKSGGGVFLIFIGREINYRRILESSLASVNPTLSRSFVTAEFVLPRRLHNDNRIVSRFSVEEDGYSLTGMLNQEMVVDLLQGGSLLPWRIDLVTRQMPLLKVKIADFRLNHPLFKYNHVIKQGLNLFVALGGLFILHLTLFGVAAKSGLRKNILFGLSLILLLPVALVVVASITWSEFTKIESRYLAESRLRSLYESVQQKLNDYLASAQFQTIKLANEIEQSSLDSDNSLLKSRLKKFVQETNASLAGYDHWWNGAIYETEGEMDEIEKNETELLKGASRTIMNVFSADGSFKVNYIDGVDGDFSSVNPAFINEVLCSWGRLFEYGRFRTGNRYSMVPLLFANKSTAKAMIIVKYPPEQIISGFVDEFLQAWQPDGKIKSLQFFRIEDSEEDKDFYSMPTQEKIVDQDQELALNNAVRGNGMLFSTHGKQLRLIKVFSGLPLLMAAEVNSAATFEFTGIVFFIVILSAILLFAFAYLILGQIYIAPVHEFIRVTRSVARGNLEVKPQIESKDEFRQLKHAFNEMIEGISQKEKMSQFVSQDVLLSVDNDSYDELDQSGRKIEASVSFIRLPDLKNLKEPDEILSLMNRFISTVEGVVKKEGGIIDKILEDTIMLVFRANNEGKSSHFLAAASAALKISQKLKQQGYEIQCGIATGSVIYGRIGSRLGKLDFTVIGDPVNLAARLKTEASAAQKTGIIIAPATIRLLKGKAGVEFLKRIPIKGKSREYPLYELIKLR